MTTRAQKTIHYTNPVYEQYFADPFVLKVDGEYWAYGTAPADAAGRQFPILHSRDLAHWRYVRHALIPLTDPPAFTYWAPEVAQRDGRFYFYYSATTSQSDEHHRIRLATADAPDGPFTDSGQVLLPEAGFTIDPHPFRDPQTNQWYMFLATDFTDDPPFGTGLAVVGLDDDMKTPLDPLALRHGRRQRATSVLPVIRASAAWQVYERNRNYKGRVWDAWHCIEGPFVMYDDGKYYCLYSAGAWYTENYGIGYAVADHPLGPYQDMCASTGPTVLRGKPDSVLGPGHNSVTIAPDGKTLVLAYHAWDPGRTARRMCIDALLWTDGAPRCDGPSTAARSL